MAGLLDLMDDSTFRLGMGLLGAGAARPDNAGLGVRLNEVMGGMDQWQQAQAQKKRAALQEQYINAQLQEMQLKTAMEKAAIEQANAKRAGFNQVFKPGLPPLAGDASIGMLPSAGTAPSIDVAKGIQLGYTAPELEAFAKLKNINMEKVARTQEVEGPNGEKLIQQYDDFGRKVGNPFAGYTAPQSVSLGDRVVFAKPQAGASFAMGQSPDSKASNALGWANYGIAAQRERREADNQNQPTFNADLGGFIAKPDAKNPNGKLIFLAGANGGTLNDNQSKALLFGSRMAEADKVLNTLAKQGDEQTGLIKRTAEGLGGVIPFVGQGVSGALGAATNWTQSPNQQKIEQAQRDFVNAVLRKESGAAISPSEFDNAKKQYFPQMGDSEEVIKQKAANRQLAVNGMLAEVPSQKRNMLLTPAPKLPGMNIDANNLDPLGLFK